MTPTCDACGDALTDADKNTAGHYRDRCLECIAADATLGDDSNPFRHLADREREAGTLSTRIGDDDG